MLACRVVGCVGRHLYRQLAHVAKSLGIQGAARMPLVSASVISPGCVLRQEQPLATGISGGLGR
ncbi:MAG: hypothetical protein ABSC06_25165 [Rhodopila sp.]